MLDIYRGICRHRKKSTLLFAAIITVVALFTFVWPKTYRSEGELLVRLGRENASLDPTVALGSQAVQSIPISRENEVNSVVEILQSRELLEQVVEKVGAKRLLAGDPGPRPSKQRTEGGTLNPKQLLKNILSGLGLYTPASDLDVAVEQLTSNLWVEPVKRSNVVRITYSGQTPEICQEVVAELIDAYLKKHITLNRPEGARDFLVKQTARLRDELKAREDDLQRIKDETGLVSPEHQRDIVVTQIGRLEEELLAVNKQLAATQAHVAAVRKAMQDTPKTLVASTTNGFSNEGTDGMREQLYALRLVEEEMEAKYQDEHPKMKEIREQVAKAKALLDREEPARTRTETAPNPVYRQGELALMDKNPHIEALQAEASSLNRQLTQLRSELQSINEAETKIARLQREVALHDGRYRECVLSLGKAKIDEALAAARLSNVKVAQAASLERMPISPNVKTNLLLGLIAATCAAVGLALYLDYRDGTWHPPGSVEQLAQTRGGLSEPVQGRRKGDLRKAAQPGDGRLKMNRRLSDRQ